MNKSIFLLAISMVFSLFFTGATSFAQNQPQRFMKQHKSHFLKEHLKQTEEMLIKALQSNSVNMSITAAQTIRELEQIFPSEPFTSFIEPLSKIVRDESADVQSRILAALALDGLHSDIGDKVIFDMVGATTNLSFKNICSALAIESFKAEDKISMK